VSQVLYTVIYGEAGVEKLGIFLHNMWTAP